MIVFVPSSPLLSTSPVSSVQSDFTEPLQPHITLRALAESQTRLPCRYKPSEGEKVVQVTWYKVLADGAKDQIITAHFTAGLQGKLSAGRPG